MITVGTLIVWCYQLDGRCVEADELLWSSSMQKHVPIKGVALVFSCTSDRYESKYAWISSDGVFSAYKRDYMCRSGREVTMYPVDCFPPIVVEPPQDEVQ
jgi:hypothetical protein